MSRGQLHPAESQLIRDELTGITIRQVTNHPSIHHQPFYYLPAYDNQMQRLIFVSHRTGRPEIFAELRASGKLVQLTEQPDISEWSVHPSHDGRYVYYTASGGAWRVDTGSFKAEELVNFGSLAGREEGMVGAAMGTTTVSHDDRWWAVPVKMGAVFRFVIIDAASGAAQIILERDTIGHPEFHPGDSFLLRYAGPYYDRMWVINRDGSNNRLIYRRNVERKEWIVHETWRPGTYEIVVSNWPHGMIGVDANNGAVRRVCSFNAWHASINRQGTLMCCDATYPDRGLQMFDPRDGVGAPTTLCLSKSSNVGEHWNTDHCPYDDATIKPYSPQHTHPHPSFSPDGRYVVFTSDRNGYSQVYEVPLPDHTT
jgi:oligogalacturonide lyase